MDDFNDSIDVMSMDYKYKHSVVEACNIMILMFKGLNVGSDISGYIRNRILDKDLAEIVIKYFDSMFSSIEDESKRIVIDGKC